MHVILILLISIAAFICAFFVCFGTSYLVQKYKYCQVVPKKELSDAFRDELMDVVYTWIDGSDPDFIAKRNAAKGVNTVPIGEGNGQNRVLENGELEASVRATLRNCRAFLGDIYIVTKGQTPKWYNPIDFPMVHIVDEADLMPPGTVSYNSNVIEMYLHRIPNLRRWFLYMNDDMFINHEVTKDVFFYEDERPLFISDKTGVSPLYASIITAFCETTARARLWTENLLIKENPESRGRHHVLYGHAPVIVNRDCYREMFESLDDDIIAEARSHVFRRSDDLVLMAFYYPSLMVDRGLAKYGTNHPSAYVFICNSVLLNEMQMSILDDDSVTFVCLNDSRTGAFEETSESIRKKLDKAYR